MIGEIPALEYLRIRNWDKWQTYRKDQKSRPPWIKLHCAVVHNPEWGELSDAERGQLISMWLLAAERDGEIPASPSLLRKFCFMSEEPDLNRFISLGFIDDVTGMYQTCDTHGTCVVPRVEESRVDQSRVDKITDAKASGGTRLNGVVPFQQIVELWHTKMPELPQCKVLTAARKGAIKQRHIQDMHDLETWEDYFTYIRRSNFLMGREPPAPGRSKPFIATLEWVCKAENHAKIYEGKYHG